MSLAYYMDHNFHAANTDGLRLRGIECITAFEDGRHRSDDLNLVDRATGLNRILVIHNLLPIA